MPKNRKTKTFEKKIILPLHPEKQMGKKEQFETVYR